MREICTSGSVRGGDGNIPTYSAAPQRRVQIGNHPLEADAPRATRLGPNAVLQLGHALLAHVLPEAGKKGGRRPASNR